MMNSVYNSVDGIDDEQQEVKKEEARDEEAVGAG